MNSIKTLVHEHFIIGKGLNILESIINKLEKNEQVSIEKINSLLDFFHVFADKCHHVKEEEIMYPELEKRGIPKESGPIGVMIYEHNEGRELYNQMKQALSDLSNNSNKKQFISAANNYINLLRQHIWKEDNVLFRMAEQVLTENEDKQITERFEHFENEQIGKEVHEKYHNLIHELEKTL